MFFVVLTVCMSLRRLTACPSPCNLFSVGSLTGLTCRLLRYSKNKKIKWLNFILNTGIEPVTLGLLDPRSTDWANQVKGEAVTPPCIEVVIGNEIFLIYISFVMILGAMSMLSMSCILCWPFVYNKKNKSTLITIEINTPFWFRLKKEIIVTVLLLVIIECYYYI